MVLRSLLLLGLVACSHSQPAPPGGAGFVSLAVAVDGLKKPPAVVISRLEAGLVALGYQVATVPGHHFAGHRSTSARLRILAQRSKRDGQQLLVELAGEATNQLGGAYRWEVTGSLSLVPAQAQEAFAQTAFHVPVFRQHETDGLAVVVAAAVPDVVSRAHAFLTQHRRGSPQAQQAKAQLPASRRPIYLVMVDRFANGDVRNDADADPTQAIAFHGGDLQGVVDRLEWIEELGMGQVWLTPVAKARTAPFMGHSAFHGYWTEDLREWEPRFGGDSIGQQLRQELNRRGLRLILDLVVNHLDYDAPLVEQQPHWFHQAGDVVDFRDPVQRITGRVHGLPDLDQDVPEVFAYLSSAARTWHERLQPDGYRLDAVQHVAPTFTKPYADLLRSLAEPAPVVIGEVFEGDSSRLSEAIVAHGLDQAFDFPFYYAMKSVFCEGGHLGRVAAVFGVDDMYPDSSQLITFLDNHDLPRIHSACAGDGPAIDRALGFLFSSRGVPAITYGTEVGLAGVDAPANRGAMRFVRHPVRDRIAKLAQLRDGRPALHSGATRILEIGDQHLVVLRYLGPEGVLVLLNHGTEKVAITMPQDLVLGSVLDGALELEGPQVALGPQSFGLVEVGGAYLGKMQSTKAKVVIQVDQLPDPTGQYRLVGLGPALGHWRPENGLPVQSGRVVLEAAGQSVVEFKLVQMKAGRPVWEPRDNRYLHVEKATKTVEIRWGR